MKLRGRFVMITCPTCKSNNWIVNEGVDEEGHVVFECAECHQTMSLALGG